MKLSSGDPLVGHVNTDCIAQIRREEFGDHLGTLTPATMRDVDQALRIALALA